MASSKALRNAQKREAKANSTPVDKYAPIPEDLDPHDGYVSPADDLMYPYNDWQDWRDMQ